MKNVNKLKEVIKKDADSQVKKIRSEASAEVAKIRAAAREQQRQFREAFDRRTAEMVDIIRRKTLAQARLGAKKDILAARESVMEELAIFLQSVDHKNPAYQKLLESRVKQAVKLLGKKLTVYCNKQDVVLCKKATSATVKEMDLIGGAILEDESGRRVDESFDTWLAESRDVMRQKIAEELE